MNKEDYIIWLKVMFTLLQKVRKEGLMAIECDIEYIEESKVLKCFNLNYENNKIPLTFMSDILRLMVGGNLECNEINEHAISYIDNICDSSSVVKLFKQNDLKNLLTVIWSILKSSMQGYAPQISLELGRFHIPFKSQPTFLELEAKIKEAKIEFNTFLNKDTGHNNFDQTLTNFITSISK